MEELDFLQVKKKSISGVLTLTGRTILLQLISFFGYFFITIFLGASEFGLFILVSAVIDILGYFSDVGLAAALVQKKEEVDLEEIRSTFTIQQVLVILVVLVLLIVSPLIRKFYSLGNEGIILLYVFGLAFFLSSLKTIPTVLLERKLDFSKIIIPQIVETVLFYATVVILAWQGLGITSYTIAVLVRAISGTVVIYILAPWKIGFAFSRKALKKLLKFGIPFQANSLLAVVKDKFMILLLGGIIGQQGIGFIGWAEKWAATPLRFLLDSTVKVAFPAFSRIQHEKQKLIRALEACLYFLAVLVFPILTGFCLIAFDLTKIIPRYVKWQPAILPLYFYCFASAWAVISTLLTNTLAAIGKIKTVFKLMIMWTVLTWAFTPALALKFGFTGAALGTAIVSISSIAAVVSAKKYLDFAIFPSVIPAIFGSFMMMIGLLVLKKYIMSGITGVILQILAGIIIYIGSLFLFNRERFLKEVRVLLPYVKK